MIAPPRVLLIDDDPADRERISEQLKVEIPEVEVRTLNDGFVLARALDQADFDLTIVDYQLGWSDGLTVTRQIKARWPDRPIIMFTANGNEQIAVNAMKAGVEDYLLKSPGQIECLAVLVRSILEG